MTPSKANLSPCVPMCGLDACVNHCKEVDKERVNHFSQHVVFKPLVWGDTEREPPLLDAPSSAVRKGERLHNLMQYTALLDARPCHFVLVSLLEGEVEGGREIFR